MRDETIRQEWARGWRVVVAAALGMYVATMYVYSLGPLVIPLQKEMKWGREEIMLALTIVGTIAVVINPLTGLIVDRFGARKIALVGTFFYCGALALVSQAGPGLASWWLAWALVGIGYSTIGSTVWITGAASQFEKRRGMAISLCLMGTAAGVTTVPYVTTLMEQAYGWRMTYIILASVGLAIVLPTTVLWFHDAREEQRKLATARAVKAATAPGYSVREILRMRQYWQLMLTAMLAVVGVTGLLVHLIPILTDAGIGALEAAALAGMVGIGKIAGRLISGYYLDRVHGSLVGAISLALPISVCILLLFTGNSLILAGAAALLLGLSVGAETDVIAYLASRFFGLRNYGFAFGTMVGAMSLGSGIGPWLGGAIFDRVGNYQWFQITLCGVFLVTVFLVATLGRYPESFGQPVLPEEIEEAALQSVC